MVLRRIKPPGVRGRKSRARRVIRFHPGDSFLHRLDPRTKLGALIAITGIALFFHEPVPLLGAFLFVVALAWISGLRRDLSRALVLFAPLVAIVIVLNGFFPKVSSGEVYFSAEVWFMHAEVTLAGILFAVGMGLRLLTIAGFSFLFIMTTSYDEFTRSLRELRLPATLVFALGYAVRSTTVLSDDAHRIMDAQRSRGLELDNVPLTRCWKKLSALFIPVSVSLLNRSTQVSDAMQCRGFCPGVRPSVYRRNRFGHLDLLMGVALAGLFLALLMVSGG